jgi:phosphinothricin acetyltransferase
VSESRLSVAPAREGHLDAINAIYNHYVETSHVTFDVQPITREECAAWFLGFSEHGPHRIFVALHPQRVVGFAHSKPFRAKAAYVTSVETTVYVDPDAIGTGVGSALYAALLAALETEDVHRAYAGLALPNAESIQLHRRFGFREVGTYLEVGRKFGRYWDVQWFERTIRGGSGNGDP